MRRHAVLAAAILACLAAATLSAQPGGAAGGGNFGLGVVLGEPTGISGKLWLGGTSAVDGVLAWSFAQNPAVSVQADYLFHFFDLIAVPKGRLPLYVGVGAAVSISDNPDVGVRIPGGVTYLFDTAPLDVFLEIAPILLLFPATTFDFSGGAGIRFYFPKGGKTAK